MQGAPFARWNVEPLSTRPGFHAPNTMAQRGAVQVRCCLVMSEGYFPPFQAADVVPRFCKGEEKEAAVEPSIHGFIRETFTNPGGPAPVNKGSDPALTLLTQQQLCRARERLSVVFFSPLRCLIAEDQHSESRAEESEFPSHELVCVCICLCVYSADTLVPRGIGKLSYSRRSQYVSMSQPPHSMLWSIRV